MISTENKKLNREAFAVALIELCKKNSFSSISVSAISEKSGLSRMFFYRNYTSKEEVFVLYFNDILEEYVRYAKDMKSKNITQKKLLVLTFEFFKNYKDFFSCLKSINLSNILFEGVIKYILDSYEIVDNIDKYQAINYAGGLYAVFIHWLENDFTDDLNIIVSLIMENYSLIKRL